MDNLLSSAENAIWKRVQQEEFALEKVSCKRKDNGFSNSSKIASLAPFLDVNEPIRAKGCLRKANPDYKTKQTVILPS